MRPVATFDFDGVPVIVASFAGAPEHPARFGSLVADPRVEMERWRGSELVTVPVIAEVVPEGPEMRRDVGSDRGTVAQLRRSPDQDHPGDPARPAADPTLMPFRLGVEQVSRRRGSRF